MLSEWKIKKKTRVRLIIGILVILTLFRLYLGIKTPILLRGNFIHDDHLYVKYAASILSGEWLGSFSSFTLLKNVSPAVLLALGYALGISYSVSMTVGYILAVVLFVLALYRLVGSRKFALVLYVFLLYSPVMFHEENVQIIYRGGYIVIFTLIVFAAVIGQHAAVSGERKREFVLWTVLACVSLPIFYYLKEDSIWILPFVCGGMLITVINLCRRKHTWKQLKIVAVISPLVVLSCVTVGYKALNYHYYGEYAVTDRSGTYYKEVLSDLVRIDDGTGYTNLKVWVSRNMIRTAAEHSETLKELLPYVEERWDAWFGEENEGTGDMFVWAFRDAVGMSGVYDRGGASVNDYYKKMHMELQEAYNNGSLKPLDGRIYISPIARGFTLDELLEYYGKRLPEVAKVMASYKENITGTQASSGPDENVAVMSNLTGAHFRWNDTDNACYRYDERIARIDNRITSLYQKTGYPIFFGAFLGILLMIGVTLSKAFRKNVSEREVSVLLVTLGMIASCLILVFAVIWFCCFLSNRRVYDYLCAAVPLMETIEIIGLYYLFCYIRNVVRKRKENK